MPVGNIVTDHVVERLRGGGPEGGPQYNEDGSVNQNLRWRNPNLGLPLTVYDVRTNIGGGRDAFYKPDITEVNLDTFRPRGPGKTKYQFTLPDESSEPPPKKRGPGKGKYVFTDIPVVKRSNDEAVFLNQPDWVSRGYPAAPVIRNFQEANDLMSRSQMFRDSHGQSWNDLTAYLNQHYADKRKGPIFNAYVGKNWDLIYDNLEQSSEEIQAQIRSPKKPTVIFDELGQRLQVGEGLFHGPWNHPSLLPELTWLGGVTVPGNAPHCGPGNAYAAYPVTASDALCRRHDLHPVFNQNNEYEQNVATYNSFNPADREYLDTFYENELWREDTTATIGAAAFELKRLTLPHYIMPKDRTTISPAGKKKRSFGEFSPANPDQEVDRWSGRPSTPFTRKRTVESAKFYEAADRVENKRTQRLDGVQDYRRARNYQAHNARQPRNIGMNLSVKGRKRRKKRPHRKYPKLKFH